MNEVSNAVIAKNVQKWRDAKLRKQLLAGSKRQLKLEHVTVKDRREAQRELSHEELKVEMEIVHQKAQAFGSLGGRFVV